MVPLFGFSETQLLTFVLVFIRILAFVISWPVFSVYSVPTPAKVLLALVISITMFPTIPMPGITLNLLSADLIFLSLKEVLLGLCMGFLTRIFFFAVTMGGSLIALSMGLASAQMFNPALNSQSTTVEQFYVTIATLFFLSINGHHMFLAGLAESFNVVPVVVGGANLAVFKSSGELMQVISVASLQVAGPVMVAIFFMNVVMGIIGRAVPQINVFVTSMPVNIMLGLGVMILMIPIFLGQIDGMLKVMLAELMRIMKTI